MTRLQRTAILAAVAALPARGLGAGSPAKATLAESTTVAAAAFMTGHWIGEIGGGLSEEIWTAPADGSMLGMWRLVIDGQVRVLELLAVSEEGDAGLTLRLRHFDRRLVAREEKDRPVELGLAQSGDGEVAFAGAGTDDTPLRLSYRRDGSDGLVAVLEKNGRRDEFRYRRRAPTAH
jgi:hypothetical protein